MKDRNWKPKIRDLAESCQGPMHAYLGHMQEPKYLRAGHNTDDGPSLMQTAFGNIRREIGGKKPQAAPSPKPSATPDADEGITVTLPKDYSKDRKAMEPGDEDSLPNRNPKYKATE